MKTKRNKLDDPDVILYSEPGVDDLEENLANDGTDTIEMPISGSPLVIGPTLANSAKPLAQGQYPNSETTDDNTSTAYKGLLSAFGQEINMSRYIVTEYTEDYENYSGRGLRKISQAEPTAGMGSNIVAIEDDKAHQNSAEDTFYMEPNADYAIDYNYAYDHQDESLDIFKGEHDHAGQIGAAKDSEEYSEEDEGEGEDEHFIGTSEEQHYHESDGDIDQEGQIVIEGDSAEEVLEELGKKLPGVDFLVKDDNDDDVEEEVETDWENDRDPKHFMVYITQQYPHSIPRHDGTSTLGCERAILFLNKLNKEISEALRADSDNILEIPKLEEMRVNMVNDVNMLRDHMNKLNKKRKGKKASEEGSELLKQAEIVKEASTPTLQVVVTPFERAIAGIIVNATVSAGKPFEDVYEFLKKKYSLDEREELTIMQLLKDMGQPIFMDRGVLGKGENKEKGQGVEFIKNYFA